MILDEFVNLFDNPCNVEEIFSWKERLFQSGIVSLETLNSFYNTIKSQNKKALDRSDLTRVISTYINTTGDACVFIIMLLKRCLIKDGVSLKQIDEITNFAYKQSLNTKAKIEAREKENARRKEERLRKLEQGLDMSKTSVSFDTARFLIRNGTSYEEMKEKVSLTLFSEKDINYIISEYRINTDEQQELISIGDILGYDYEFHTNTNDLLKSFPSFFDSSRNDTYHLRALSMLDLTIEDGVSLLRNSFDTEPLKIKEASEGKYTIGSNGMHRFSVLRTLYLIEMMHAKDNIEKEKEIHEKYRIPALVENIDYIKTYSNYLLSVLNISDWVKKELDENHKMTGRTIVELKSGGSLTLTDEELIKYVGEVIRREKEEYSIDWMFKSNDESFLAFLYQVVPDLMDNYEYGGPKC